MMAWFSNYYTVMVMMWPSSPTLVGLARVWLPKRLYTKASTDGSALC